MEQVDSPSYAEGGRLGHPKDFIQVAEAGFKPESLHPEPVLITINRSLAFHSKDSVVFLASAFSTGIMRFPKLGYF